MAESLVRCPVGHFYDSSKQNVCPWCAPSEAGQGALSPPPPLPAPPAPPVVAAPPPPPQVVEPSPGPPPIPNPPSQPDALPPGIPATAIPVDHVDPVVGWLVCVAGPDKGRDFRLHAERNWVGRSPLMDVCVPGDMTVSRERHAAVLFDPKRSNFWLTPGQGAGLVHLNGEVVHGPQQLKAEDVVELGQSKLVFVPFCGEKHAWGKSAE